MSLKRKPGSKELEKRDGLESQLEDVEVQRATLRAKLGLPPTKDEDYTLTDAITIINSAPSKDRPGILLEDEVKAQVQKTRDTKTEYMWDNFANELLGHVLQEGNYKRAQTMIDYFEGKVSKLEQNLEFQSRKLLVKIAQGGELGNGDLPNLVALRGEDITDYNRNVAYEHIKQLIKYKEATDPDKHVATQSVIDILLFDDKDESVRLFEEAQKKYAVTQISDEELRKIKETTVALIQERNELQTQVRSLYSKITDFQDGEDLASTALEDSEARAKDALEQLKVYQGVNRRKEELEKLSERLEQELGELKEDRNDEENLARQTVRAYKDDSTPFLNLFAFLNQLRETYDEKLQTLTNEKDDLSRRVDKVEEEKEELKGQKELISDTSNKNLELASKANKQLDALESRLNSKISNSNKRTVSTLLKLGKDSLRARDYSTAKKIYALALKYDEHSQIAALGYLVGANRQDRSPNVDLPVNLDKLPSYRARIISEKGIMETRLGGMAELAEIKNNYDPEICQTLARDHRYMGLVYQALSDQVKAKGDEHRSEIYNTLKQSFFANAAYLDEVKGTEILRWTTFDTVASKQIQGQGQKEAVKEYHKLLDEAIEEGVTLLTGLAQTKDNVITYRKESPENNARTQLFLEVFGGARK